MRLPLVLLAIVLLTGCVPRTAPLEPRLHYTAKKRDITARPSPFPPLTAYEHEQPWAQEFLIARAFANELDLYRAVTTYKRALVLLPVDQTDRRRQIEYDIALAYFLGDHFQEAIQTVENGSLARATRDFPAYHDLLLVLYECYMETEQETRAAIVAQQLSESDQRSLAASSALRRADLTALGCMRSQDRDINDLMSCYCNRKKSVRKAQQLNALLPGLGYLYVGQKQSAITAAVLNGLFIFGAYQFFSRGYWPAGVFIGSLELGWYIGGIYGAGEAAHLYNRRLYEDLAGPQLCQRRLFPSMMLKFSF